MLTLSFDPRSGNLFVARVLKITRIDGAVLRVAEAEIPITVGSETFNPLPGSIIGSSRKSLGGNEGSLQIEFVHAVDGTLDTADLVSGLYDGATVEMWIVDRTDLSSLGDMFFTGTIQPVIIDIMGSGSFDVRSIVDQSEVVTQTYQPMCRTDLFSILCGLDKTLFARTATVAEIIDDFNFTVSGLGAAPDDDHFAQGVGVADNGVAFEIAAWLKDSLQITTYLPVVISPRLAAGQSVTLYPGCDKTSATCTSKFANGLNFQGEAHFLGYAAAA